MNRQQLQAEIKTLKLQGLVSKKFDARQSNDILAAKIAEVKTEKVAPEVVAAPKQEFVPIACQKTVKKVLKASGNFTGKALDNAVKLTMEAGNKVAADRTMVDNVIVATFVKLASVYNQAA